MNDYSYEKGIAFIVEGATERVFYEEYLKKLCSERGMTITKDENRRRTSTPFARRTGRFWFSLITLDP